MVATFQRIGAAALSTARQLAADQAGQPFSSIAERYDLLTRYYHNEQYDVLNGVVQVMKGQSGLYRNIRPIRNPMRRAVDWYPGHVYPGVMTPDGLPLPDGTPSCVPFAADTDPALRLAMTQALVWANWGAERWQVIRGLAMLGDAFGEIEVDYERGKVYPKFHHPGRVTDIEWNGSGDVVMYRIEIPQVDDKGNGYTWGKRVDKDTITTLRDGKPFDFDGQGATIPNEWGFVPAAWAQFRNVGGQHGASIIDGVRSKIDELNSSLSAIHDYIQKFVNQGVIIAAPGGRKGFEEAMASKATTGATADRTNPQSGRQELGYVFAPPGTTFFKPLDNLGLAETVAHVDGLVMEIEKDLPETVMDEQLRAMSQVTGPGASRMMGDVVNRLTEVEGNADQFLIKLGQMSVSIGGELANSGAWGRRRDLTEQQQLFLPFSLQSWDRGALANVTLLPRPLFSETAMERVQQAAAIEALRTPTGMRIAGLDDKTIFGPRPEGQEPPRRGLLEEQSGASSGLSDLLGRALNTGQV